MAKRKTGWQRKLWTDKEIDILKRSFKEGWEWEELFKALPDRTEGAIIRRSDLLKKEGKIGTSNQRWTPEEDTLLISAYQAGALETVHAQIPRRTIAATQARLQVLRKTGQLGDAPVSVGKKTVAKSVSESPIATGEGYELRGNGYNDQVLLMRSATVRDPNIALREAGVDLEIWEIKDFVVNKWDVAAKKDIEVEGSPARPNAWRRQVIVTELWQVKVWLRRKDKNPIQTALDKILEGISKRAPKYPKAPKRNSGSHMLEISLFDSHFGKLAWAPETGTSYDLKIAQAIYKNAVEDLLSKSLSFGIEHILFPIGQDFFHINDASNHTPKGKNPLDVDGRLAKIFDAGCESIVEAISLCLTIAPVEIIWVPGNHDRETSLYLCKFLKAWFRHVKDVVVDDGPKFRKYKLYGVNLIGFTHGDAEKHQALPTIMAGEQPELWAKSKLREWHLGHFHKKKETSYSVGDSHVGVMVKVLPSLCGTDAWHFEMGYVKGRRSAEAYLWSKEMGYAGHLASNIL